MFRRVVVLFIISAHVFAADAVQTTPKSCEKWPGLLQRSCKRWHQIWSEGNTDLIVTGYAWHNRYTYTPEKIKSYNEKAYGGGLGRSFIDEDGDFHGLFAFGFPDSHKNFEPVVGYGFLKNWSIAGALSMGLGFTGLITARPEINNGIPFPGVLPLAGALYKRLTLFATYIPGLKGTGNVLFVFAKWQLSGS